jgi:uncharacterized protein (TIGR02466 family)
MNEAFEFGDLFSTPLMRTSNTLLAKRMLPICKSILQDKDSLTYHWGYKTTYTPEGGLERDQRMKPFTTYLYRIAKGFVRTVGLDVDVESNPQIFISQLDRGDKHARHCHPGSTVSGVFYVSVPDESSPIKFFDPRPVKEFNHHPLLGETPYNTPTTVFSPADGDMIMWESWLHHEVPPNRSNERIAIIFNL